MPSTRRRGLPNDVSDLPDLVRLQELRKAIEEAVEAELNRRSSKSSQVSSASIPVPAPVEVEGGSLKGMTPIQIWKHLLTKNGIKGVLRKSDPRYDGIKRVYNEILSDRSTYD